MHAAEALARELGERGAQVRRLRAHHVRAELPVGAQPVARERDVLGRVEHDRDGGHVVLPREREQRAPGLAPHVGRVDHGEQPAREPQRHRVVQERERVAGGALIVGIVGDHAAALVGGHGLVRAEVRAGEGALAGARRADEQHEGQRGDRERRRVGHGAGT